MERKIQSWKKKEVELIKKELSNYNIIGIVDMTNMPSAQLQQMRSTLKKDFLIKMSKARLVKLAINQLKDQKKNIAELLPYIRGMPALIYTKENPFRLAKSLQKSKSKAPAKGGQLAPNDITIPAGPTPFSPGPVIGELSQAGLKTQVVDGKIHIKEDKIVVKEGEVITSKIASLLSKLKIEPMEIGLNLTAAYEDGIIYKKDVLAIDDKVYLQNIQTAHMDAIKLALAVEYPEKSILELLIKKSYLETKALASAVNYEEKTEIKEVNEEPKIEEKQEEQKKEETVENTAQNTMKEQETDEARFKREQEEAQKILNKMQEQKMKQAPYVVKKEEPKINKVKVGDIIK